MASHSAHINPAIVRSYDLRGEVGRELRQNDAHALGLIYATAALARGCRSIAVARDGRDSSPQLECALIDGLVEGGARVTRIGLGPTPLLYFAVHACRFDGGIMVTGSHNARGDNGFKLLLDDEPVYGKALRTLVNTAPSARSGGSSSEHSTTGAYVHSLAHLVRDVRPLSVVWDCGNGATGAVIPELTALLPGRHVVLNASVDGRFPAHHPDPAVAENMRELQAAVVEHRADLGFAFDGDGDRIGVVDETGQILWPDQILLLLAAEVLARHPGAPVVADVKSSRTLFDGIAALGGRAVMAPSGYVLIRQQMLETRAPLAGEMSGHILFAEAWHGADDALYVAMNVLRALSGRRSGLASFRKQLPSTVATPEIRMHCPAERKAVIVRDVAATLAREGADVSTVDGVRVTNADGWWLLRASGTEAKLTVRCEAASDIGLLRLKAQLAAHLRRHGLQLPAE